jgi:hypothetical protein
MLSLIDVATKKGKPEQIKAYWNTYHCLNQLQSSEGRLYGKYCKNRFCTLCLSNGKADILNRYLAALKGWPQPFLVTLTVKAVKHPRLALIIDKMIQGFQRIKDKYRKKCQRGKAKN